MTIKYKIRFEDGGMTITQITEDGPFRVTSESRARSGVVASHELGSSFPTARSGSGGDDAGAGGVEDGTDGGGGADPHTSFH